jgi:hypothetical protein
LVASRRRVAVDLGEHRAVVEGVHDDGHALVVLRRGAHHGRAADVDVLDGVLEGAAGLRDRGGERIEIHRDEVNRVDAVLGHHGVVHAAPAEQPAVDLRVQRLDASIHDFGEACHGSDVDDLDAVLAQQRGGAARGQDRDAAAAQRVREFEQAFLVRDAEQCPADGVAHCRGPVSRRFRRKCRRS